MTDRRHVLRGAAAAALAASLPAWPAPRPAARPRVVVVGGGMAGTTVAKYLRLWSGGTVQVTLVDRQAAYTSCIMSSLVLTGQRSLSSLRFGYRSLRERYGVRLLTDEVLSVDPVAARVTLGSGQVLAGDRVVVAAGIEFDTVPGQTDPNAMPHAWKAGPQTNVLARQLDAMPAGGTVVLTIPPVPYRCPPGPYERACLLADWLKQRKPGSRLVLLDANPDFVVEKDNFSRAFFELYPDVIEYRTNAVVDHVHTPSRTVFLRDGSSVRGDVVNLIPRQRAGQVVIDAGLATATEGRFAPVDVLSYASSVSGAQKVHVIGDSSATTQPKAGHIANQEAKVCADAILRAFKGLAPDPAPVTNSACFSTITMSQASWLTAGFQYDPATRLMTPVAAAGGASEGWSREQFEDMDTWFKSLMADSFS